LVNLFKSINKKTTAAELLSSQVKQAKLNAYGWSRPLKPNLTQDETDTLEATLNCLNDNLLLDRFENKLDKLTPINRKHFMFKELSKSLRLDIEGYVDCSFHKTLTETEIGFLPTGSFEAYCINQDQNEQVIEGFVICLSQGLYFSLQLLFKSLVLENIDGELSKYRQSGSTSYSYAINLFFDPTFSFDTELFFNGLSADIQGELAAYQHNLSTIILKFVTLHEFAHIINNDLDILKINKIKYFSDEILESTLDSNTHWKAELKADEFALNSICPKSMDSIGAWANFSQIYLFLFFISDIEEIRDHGLSATHPPSRYRAKYLLKIMTDKFHQSDDAKDNIKWVENAILRWRKS